MISTFKNLSRVLFFAGCLQLATSQNGHAQSDNKTFRHFTPQDGFPSYVFRMAQDPKGQIWMTGPSGLHKFDGYTVHHFIHDPGNEYSIPDGLIMEILAASNGMIWLTGGSGVGYLDPWTERFHQVSIPESIPPVSISSLNNLIETSDHSIWTIGNNGLYRFNQPTQSQLDTSVRFYPYDFSVDEEVTVFNMEEVSDGVIWLTSNQGLIQFNRATENYTKMDPLSGLNTELEVTQLTPIIRDINDNIWLGVDGGLIVFRKGTNKPEVITTLGKENFDLSMYEIRALDSSEGGTIFISIINIGILHYDPYSDEVIQYSRQLNSQDGPSENVILDILEDRNGNIWMAHSSSGMSMMYDENWTYSYHQIIAGDSTNTRSQIIHDLAEDQQSNLWLGTSYGLAFVPADGGASKSFLPNTDGTSSNITKNNITDIHLSEDVILAVESNGDAQTSTFYIFNIQQEQFNQINIPDSLATFSFDQVVASESFFYWTARGSSQLVALNKEDLSIATFDLPLDYPATERASMRTVEAQPIITKSGELYILYKNDVQNVFATSDWSYYNFNVFQGTFKRVPMSTDSKLRKYTPADTQFPSTLKDAVIWSMAENGVLKENLNNGTFEYFPLVLNSNELIFSSLLQARNGTIWFSVSSGAISKFDPQSKKLNTYHLELSRKPRFIFNNLESSTGILFFGGPGGYIQFNPDEIREQVDIQHLHITEFRTGKESISIVELDENYEVDFENNNISFSFLAINYRSPDNQYRYRLLGYDDGWVDMGTQRSIFLANLPFGDYTFQVQAATPGSSFSDESILSEVSFAILPPWWRTIPAYLSYLLLFTGFVFGADRFQRRRLIQKERERAREKELAQAKEIERAYQNLEVAHKDLEQAHSNLKSAQSQLIQQEKLASLGQLTAGIAHEIKNPLNFVNNFASVSRELVEEVRNDVASFRLSVFGEDSSLTTENRQQITTVEETLSDVEYNLNKIVEHGSRADGIVKSMLQHSRGGTGKMEPTDLNALVSEFVNLSYHGMRAGKDPIDAEVTLDLDSSIGEVPLVYEDFSRVILNICTNAFDAMRMSGIGDQGSGIGEQRGAHLQVSTRREGGRIAIEIEDNGPGIPDDIKDKILQPFFTTKKGTQGTGLGLSITHDIVKAHGGNLEIQSKPGQTIFTIRLNV